MRYIQLAVTDNELTQRAKRLALSRHLECLNGETHVWVGSQRTAAEPGNVYDVICAQCKVQKKDVDLAHALRNVVLGEKEAIAYILGNCVKNLPGQELRKYIRIVDIITALQDPGWIKLEEDDWRWLKDKLNSIDYGLAQVDKATGAEVPVFNKMFRDIMGRVITKIEDAKDVQPQDLAF